MPFQRSYEPGLRQRAFVKRMLSLTSPEVPIYVHQSFVIRKDLFFYTDRDLINVPTLAWVMARPAAERDRGVLMLIEPVHSPQELATLTELGRTYPIWRLGEHADLPRDHGVERAALPDRGLDAAARHDHPGRPQAGSCKSADRFVSRIFFMRNARHALRIVENPTQNTQFALFWLSALKQAPQAEMNGVRGTAFVEIDIVKHLR